MLAAPLGPADGELIFSLASSQHEGASGKAVVTTEHCLFSSTILWDGGDLGILCLLWMFHVMTQALLP